MSPEKVSAVFVVIDNLGIIAFAFSGAAAAMKKEADIVGVVILSLVACSFGGLARDLLLGDTPPELLRSNRNLMLAAATGLAVYFFYPVLNRMARPLDFFDALGLGLFAVAGAEKAMNFGLGAAWSVGLGLTTAVGGGVMRDVMLAQPPTIFRSEIYASPAILGALILVAGRGLKPELAPLFMLAGAFVCTGLRLLAIHFGWHVRR
ncbi:MAG: TRIC cation channel family protein [Candidatus Adiutrix sp.]|jgi:uncharacterized membrane protein YeiH|nr:TRIC cation channel family protein [Candidatus Adiutrix sp.]